MTDPISKTFDVLAKTANTYAVDALIPALDMPDDRIRLGALSVLLKRHHVPGLVEIIRRFDTLTSEMRSELEANSGAMGKAIRHCLVHPEEDLQSHALKVVLLTDDFEQLPILLSSIAVSETHEQQVVLDVIREMVGRLYEYTSDDGRSSRRGKYLRNAERIRSLVASALNAACRRPQCRDYEEIVESVLILGTVESNSVKQLLRPSDSESHKIAERLLLQCTHRGVMSLIVEFMTLAYPNPIMLRAIQERDDPEFACHLLQTWPRKLSGQQQKNFQQVERVVWLDPDHLDLEFIPPGLHLKLVNFLSAISLPGKHKLKAIEWLIGNGSHEARQAATEILNNIDSRQIQALIIDGLESENPDTQAWATHQLRSKRIPEAFTLLIGRLDSPIQKVQQAAREELGDFNLERLLSLYEFLEPSTCVLAGSLIQKIDPTSLSKLREEMANPILRKRLRATKAAAAMNVQEHVADVLIHMLDDPDMLIRRTAVDILGSVNTDEALTAITSILDDESPRVREEAVRSLSRLAQRRKDAVLEPNLARLDCAATKE